MDMSVGNSDSGVLVDSFGRVVRYLRVSVTDRCNLRCRYCRDDAVPFIPHRDILRFEEIETILAEAAALGVRKLRFTGGEPFARKGFPDFLGRVRRRFPDMDLRLTSNGTLLGNATDRLREFGVAVNLSLDSLNRERFAAITGRDLLPVVLRNLHKMLESGIALKINAVALRGVNDDDVPALAALAMDHPLDVRFIEFMPVGEGEFWSENLLQPAANILAAARRHWELLPVCPETDPTRLQNDPGPARLWRLRDRQGRLSVGRFGIISSVTQCFCRSCNRLRLTAEGNLRACLYDDREYPVRDLLRTEGPEAVRRVLSEAVDRKPLGSELLAARRGPVARRRMSSLGG